MQKGKDGKREMRTRPSWSFVRRKEIPLRRSSSLSSSALRAVSHAVIDQKECKRMFAPKTHAAQKHRKRLSRNPSKTKAQGLGGKQGDNQRFDVRPRCTLITPLRSSAPYLC